MSAAEYNFNLDKGSIFYISFSYLDDSSQIINLTNWLGRFSFTPVDGSFVNTTTTYFTGNTNANYSFLIDEDNGKLILRLPSSTTSSFDFSAARYDLDLKAPNELYSGAGDNIFKLVKGTITILPGNSTSPQDFPISEEETPCEGC
jgi:hypothetical protein